MEQNLSWIKAYGVSILLHVVIALLFALGLAQVAAEKEQQTYVIDLAASDFSQGSGDGNVGGTGTAPFDKSGFWVAVNANKEYPYMAIKRRLEGSASVGCTVTSGGSVVGVFLEGSSGHDILDDAAVAAVRAVGSYPNPSGHDFTVSVPVSFHLN